LKKERKKRKKKRTSDSVNQIVVAHGFGESWQPHEPLVCAEVGACLLGLPHPLMRLVIDLLPATAAACLCVTCHEAAALRPRRIAVKQAYCLLLARAQQLAAAAPTRSGAEASLDPRVPLPFPPLGGSFLRLNRRRRWRIANFGAVCDALARPAAHVRDFLLVALGEGGRRAAGFVRCVAPPTAAAALSARLELVVEFWLVREDVWQLMARRLPGRGWSAHMGGLCALILRHYVKEHVACACCAAMRTRCLRVSGGGLAVNCDGCGAERTTVASHQRVQRALPSLIAQHSKTR
jgi:hypothetical protein